MEQGGGDKLDELSVKDEINEVTDVHVHVYVYG
jgi:hypothetical protein